MPLTRNDRVAARFAARAGQYDAHADLQRDVAARLAELLPRSGVSKVLEVGCGTGLLTRHLVDRYPPADFLITDLAPEMLAKCEAVFTGETAQMQFAIMDGETPQLQGRFDVIALSMTAQWFENPAAALTRLAGHLTTGGSLFYATLAPDNFPEWRAALQRCDAKAGIIEVPSLPGALTNEAFRVDYGSALEFLRTIKSIGASVPRPQYEPLSAGALRQVLADMDRACAGAVTWRIAFGRLDAQT